MTVSTLDNILWAVSFLANVSLFVVLLVRARYKTFPVFTLIIGFDIARDVALFVAYRAMPQNIYGDVYWGAFGVDFALQALLIFEISRIVLRPTGTWVRDARLSFMMWGLAGALVAFGLSYAVHPHAPKSVGAWGVRAFLVTSLLFCELFLAMMFSAQRLGLVWRNHVMGLGQGLTIWALVSVAVDAAHTYLGNTQINDFRSLEHIRTFAYIAAVIYWAVIFWLPEPKRRPLSPEMQNYLVALHSKVQYDASQVGSTPNSR